MAHAVNLKCWSIVQYLFGTRFIHPGVEHIRSHTFNCIVNLVSFSQIAIVFNDSPEMCVQGEVRGNAQVT